MESRITSKCGFSDLDMIWCEVINHVKYLKGSGQMMFRSFCMLENKMTGEYWGVIIDNGMSEKSNDRKINELYNGEKFGRQIGIVGG